MTRITFRSAIILGAAILVCGALAYAVSGGGARPGSASHAHEVSQRNRSFNPASIAIKAGDTLTIVNDDGYIHHHAYVATPGFAFDSGDQEPGSRTDIVFTKAGIFAVLCGIHPKMRLIVVANPR